MTISVVIPAHNAEEHIETSIKSLSEQEYKDFEVIIVENGSKDNTYKKSLNLMKKYKLNGKVLHISEGDVSKARNVGIDESSGEYILFLDADDALTEKSLTYFHKSIETYNADMIFGKFNRIYGRRILRYEKYHKIPNGLVCSYEILKGFLIGKYWISIGSALFRKKVLQNHYIRFIEENHTIEDILFIFDFLYNSSSVAAINSVVMNYYIHANSLSSSHKIFEMAKDMEVYSKRYNEEITNIIKNHKIPYLIIRDIMKCCDNDNCKVIINDWAKKYLENTKLYFSKFGIYTYIASKIILFGGVKNFCRFYRLHKQNF